LEAKMEFSKQEAEEMDKKLVSMFNLWYDVVQPENPDIAHEKFLESIKNRLEELNGNPDLFRQLSDQTNLKAGIEKTAKEVEESIRISNKDLEKILERLAEMGVIEKHSIPSILDTFHK
jgi:hypothetical protein